MRCPHCAGQIPDRSRFCGICGRKISAEAAAAVEADTQHPNGGARPGSSASGGGSMSLFELPVSKGARFARVFSILALDTVLVGTGIAMILSYMNARDQHRSRPQPADAAVARAEVQVLPPEPVLPTRTASRPPATEPRAKKPAANTPVKRPGKRPRPGKTKPATAKPVVGKPKPPPKRPPPPQPAAPPDAAPGPSTGWDPGVGPGSESADAGSAPPAPTATPIDAGVAAPPVGGPTEEEITLLANRIALVVDRQRSQLQRCYSQAAKGTSPSDPLAGKVVIQFEVLPSGKARNVRAMSNTTQSTQLANCLRSLVQSWTFPPSSRPIEFAWPFVFKAPK